MRFKIWIPVLAVLVIAGGWLGYRQYVESHKPRESLMDKVTASVSSTLPPVTLPDLNGKQVNLTDFKGKVLVVNLWAAWCPPCRKEMPEFVKLQKELAPKGVQFVGLGIDEDDAIRNFAQQVGTNYPILLGGEDGDQLLLTFGDIQGALPYTVLVDRSGKIRDRHLGFFPEAELRQKLAELI